MIICAGCVGKTSTVLRYVENKFESKHLSTLQVKIFHHLPHSLFPIKWEYPPILFERKVRKKENPFQGPSLQASLGVSTNKKRAAADNSHLQWKDKKILNLPGGSGCFHLFKIQHISNFPGGLHEQKGDSKGWTGKHCKLNIVSNHC